MTHVDQVLQKLYAMARPDQLQGMAGYGMSVERRLGVSVPDLRKLAKEVGKDHQVAQALWTTGLDDARILASMVDVADAVTGEQMEAWVADFNSWDVCDQVCMNLFEKSPLAWQKIREWHQREEEFVKRAAYALIACLAWHDKKAPDTAFLDLMPLVKEGATDSRNYVKKAVSWALRNVGKRNQALHAAALETAHALQEMDSRPARWIAADAIRDLTSDATQRRLEKAG